MATNSLLLTLLMLLAPRDGQGGQGGGGMVLARVDPMAAAGAQSKLSSAAEDRFGDDDHPDAPPLSAATCDLKDCAKGASRRAQMCLCQRVALMSSGPSPIPPAYLRGNFGSDMSQGPVGSLCRQMASSKTIDEACIVNCNIMHHWVRASPGTDAMVCMKAVEEAKLVEQGDIMMGEVHPLDDGCSKKGALPCGSGGARLTRLVTHEGGEYCCKPL
jgi:hypothetical protein